MTLRLFTATSLGTACVLVVAFGLANAPAPAAAADPVEPGSFVWHDLLTKDVAGARRFYGELLGWRFEDTKRGDRPYVIARAGAAPVAGIVDVSGIADAGTQWLSFMAVASVDTTVALFQSGGGKVLVQPRDLPLARVAIVADPQGAPLGLAQMRRDIPGATQPTATHFFWQEYLARATRDKHSASINKSPAIPQRSPTHVSASSTTSSRKRAAALASSNFRQTSWTYSPTGCRTYW